MMENATKEQLLNEIKLLKAEVDELKNNKTSQSQKNNEFIDSEQLKLVLQGANVGWCDWDIRTDKETYNDILPALLGYEHSEMPKNASWWKGITHPDDYVRVKHDIQEHFDGKTEFYQNKHRLKTKSGDWKWFFEHGKVIERDKTGNPLRMIVTLRDIDSQYRAESAIKISENKFRTIFENAPILIDSFDKDGKCVLWNKECEKVFGWTIDEINSTQNTLALFYHDEEEYNKVYESITEKPSGQFREWHPYTKSGKRLTTRWANFEIAEGLVINMGYDITHQKKLEAEQKESEQRFRAISEATYEAIFLSEKGICINTNAAATRMFGYTYDEIIGIFGTDVIADESKDLVVKNMMTNNEAPYEAIALRKDGTTFPAEFQGRMFEYKGKTIRITSVRDITKRKENEMALIAAKEKAEESDRLKTAFLQNLSHEIRTPMNGILGFTDLIKMSGLSADELEEYIEIIENSGTRLINTINDLMDISMIVSNQIDVSVTETDIGKLLNGLFSKFQLQANKKGINIVVDKSLFTKEVVVKTDSQKVRAILTKLISNAIKFTSEGEVEFGYKITVKNTYTELCFFVNDSGIGIPKDRLSSIFERFMQVDSSSTRSFEGSGLGLSIIKEYAEMLNGKIWAESTPGNGSQFFFTLPCVIN